MIFLTDEAMDDQMVVDTIIHECVHAKQQLFSFIGEDEIGDEAEAYLVAHMCSLMFTEFSRQQEAAARKLASKEEVNAIPT